MPPERAPLGPRHGDVTRLRSLLRDARARVEEGVLVLEGPRAVLDALDRGVALEAVYVASGADATFAPDAARIEASGCPVVALKDGVIERISTTRTPQPMVGVARRPERGDLGSFGDDGCVLVLVGVADPGNVGTLVRSAEASGAVGVVCGAGSADVFSPKVVRASAGAVFGVPIVEVADAVGALAVLGGGGRRRYGTIAVGGRAYDAARLGRPCAIVLGNEAHGLASGLDAEIDEWLTIPMAGAAESLNVAMAGSVLLFEVARRRAERSP